MKVLCLPARAPHLCPNRRHHNLKPPQDESDLPCIHPTKSRSSEAVHLKHQHSDDTQGNAYKLDSWLKHMAMHYNYTLLSLYVHKGMFSISLATIHLCSFS